VPFILTLDPARGISSSDEAMTRTETDDPLHRKRDVADGTGRTLGGGRVQEGEKTRDLQNAPQSIGMMAQLHERS